MSVRTLERGSKPGETNDGDEFYNRYGGFLAFRPRTTAGGASRSGPRRFRSDLHVLPGAPDRRHVLDPPALELCDPAHRRRRMDGERCRDQGGHQRPGDERAQHPGAGRESEVHGERQRGLHRRCREPGRERGRGLSRQPQSRRAPRPARDSQTVTALNPATDEDPFSFTPFTRHPFFSYVNRWILERVICPGRQVIVDLGCGPCAVTELILERVHDQQPPPRVICVDPSPSALQKARAAISSRLAEFVQGSAEWLSKLVKS